MNIRSSGTTAFRALALPRLRNALFLLTGLPLVLLALAGCDSREAKEVDLSKRIPDAELAGRERHRDQDVLFFGFDLRGGPQEDARQYVPFLNYLKMATGLQFELRFTSANSNIVDDLGQGVVQVAAVGAHSYLAARAKYGVIPLVRGLNSQGRAEYQSVIVVAPDSPIQGIEELRGRTFAFSSATSTQGCLIPRIILAEHGLSLDDLAGYNYVGSHQNCANAVAAGSFEAGGLQDILGRRLAAKGFVRIIHTSEFYPSSGIAANRDVPPEVLKKIKRALLDFEPNGAQAASLYHWDRTEMPNGFTESNDQDYEKLREWSLKFGLLETPAKAGAQ